jgi:hypothetical protein
MIEFKLLISKWCPDGEHILTATTAPRFYFTFLLILNFNYII